MGCLKLSYYEAQEALEKSPLKIFSCIEDKNDSSIFCIDYSPFGLAFNSWQRVTAKENKFKFNQGTGDKTFRTERVTDLELNWDMTKYRTYDYTIGRFTSIDPLSDFNSQESRTPYQYAYNNPVRYSDPNGDCPKCGLFRKAFTESSQNIVSWFENSWMGQTIAATNDAVSYAVNEVFRQHPEDVTVVVDVNETQTEPQSTDTKWFDGTDPLTNTDAPVVGNEDSNVVLTGEGGATKVSNSGTGNPTQHNVRVENQRNDGADTVFIEGNGERNIDTGKRSHKVVIDGDTTYIPETDQTQKQLEKQRSYDN